MHTLLRQAGVAVLAATVSVALPAIAQEKVTYNMSWLPQGSSIGPIVAKELGYYKDAGLDVNIVRGYGGNRTANELDQGQFEFGYVDPISLVLNRSNGGKIRLVGAINTHWPGGICYVQSKVSAKNLDGLGGLTMGGGSASPVQNVIPAWLAMNGKPKDFIRLLRMDPAVVDASLIEGRIDLAECWRASNRATLHKQAAAASVKIAWIEYSDYGLDAYGSGFATTEETIAKRPDLVRKFLKATYRGYEYAKANPDKAAELMLKAFPTVDHGVALEQINDINDLITDKTAPDKRLGYIRDDRMRATVDFVDKAYGLNGKIKPADVYTNELLN